MSIAASKRSALLAIPRIERAAHAVGLRLASLPDVDVSQAEAHVLSYLRASGSARINDIHHEFGHRRSTLTSVLDRLEKRKLLKRSVDAQDRRAIRITLTAAGVSLAEKVYRALHALEAQALRGISASDVATVLRALDAFAASTRP